MRNLDRLDYQLISLKKFYSEKDLVQMSEDIQELAKLEIRVLLGTEHELSNLEINEIKGLRITERIDTIYRETIDLAKQFGPEDVYQFKYMPMTLDKVNKFLEERYGDCDGYQCKLLGEKNERS